jgi:hypothetical protein
LDHFELSYWVKGLDHFELVWCTEHFVHSVIV